MNKIFNLKGRIIVLTGSAGLLGSQYAQILSDAGATLVLVDTNMKKNKELQKKLSAKGMTLDDVLRQMKKDKKYRK